jgi:mono/diheme cytochrome c family protein
MPRTHPAIRISCTHLKQSKVIAGLATQRPPFVFPPSCDFRFNASCTTTKYVDSSKAIRSTDINDTIVINQGKTLFVTNCNSCHAILKTDNYLQGVVQRLGENYLKLYLTRQDSLISTKDKHALGLKREFGNLGNSHNFDFSDEQLNAIIEFLRRYSS